MMKFLVACALLVAIQIAISVDWGWVEFKQKYDKHYPPGEDEYRHMIYLDNKAKILDHNSLYELGVTTFRMDINQFGDLTNQEYISTMNGFRQIPPLKCNSYKPDVNVRHPGDDLPSSIDWRDYGYVTPVKNQGQCGCCWAFSATGSLEGQHFAQTGQLISLSEQQLVDCSVAYGNAGCEGGTTDNALAYVKDNGGIDSEDSYPYTERLGSCKYNAANVGGNCTGYVDLPCGDEYALKEAVATIGPISVAVDSTEMSFQFYTNGVYYEPACSSNVLSHGMLIVGYGNENGDDYWLVKNSWGKSWGSQGYIKMARNRSNNCGIASAASYPIVK